MAQVNKDFRESRGTSTTSPAMWCATPYDREGTEGTDGVGNFYSPSFSAGVERVVLNRMVGLARAGVAGVAALLEGWGGEDEEEEDALWGEIFGETKQSLGNYNLLLKVEPKLVVDPGSKSIGGDYSHFGKDGGATVQETPFSRSMAARHQGLKSLRKKIYKNLSDASSVVKALEFNPVGEYVGRVRERFGKEALFFYNASCPEVIAVLIRPGVTANRGFSAVNSEFRKPVGVEGKGEVTLNVEDFIHELKEMGGGVVVDAKERSA